MATVALVAAWTGRIDACSKVTTDATISGLLVGGVLTAELAGYYSHDDGRFTNQSDGSHVGKFEQYIIHPVFRLTPAAGVEVLLRLEHAKATGDGSIAHDF